MKDYRHGDFMKTTDRTLKQLSVFAKIQHQQKSIRHIIDTSAFRKVAMSAAKMADAFNHQQESIRHIIDMSAFSKVAMSAANMAADIQCQFEPIHIAAAKMAADMQYQFEPIHIAAAKMADAFKDQQEQLRRTADMVASGSIFASAAKMAEVFQLRSRGMEGLIPSTLLQAHTFKLLDSLDSTHGNFEQDTFDNDFEKINVFIDEKCKSLPPSNVSFLGVVDLRNFLITLLVSLVVASLQSHTASQDTDKIIDAIINSSNKSDSVLIESIERLAPTVKENYPLYVVIRSVNLRSRPTTKSPVIEQLLPNQIVELIQPKKKWIYVRYFDFINGLPKTGWVSKKYLKRIKS
jgi:hypothetical protein